MIDFGESIVGALRKTISQGDLGARAIEDLEPYPHVMRSIFLSPADARSLVEYSDKISRREGAADSIDEGGRVFMGGVELRTSRAMPNGIAVIMNGERQIVKILQLY